MFGSIYSDRAVDNKAKMPAFEMKHPQVFLTIKVGEEMTGRVTIELFSKQVPKTAENFRALCTGEYGLNLHYKSRAFTKIVPGQLLQGGSIATGNGTGAQSIYGTPFADEGVWIPHSHRGLLSMANRGPDTNGS
jgi:peptidylprolyl isomerase